MAEFIAVQGCMLELSSGEGIRTIESSPSNVSKCNNKGVYTTPLSFSISGYTGGDIVGGSGSGFGTIVSSAQYTKAENKLVMLEGDTSEEITITGVNSRGQTATAIITVKIKSAGQSVAKGE